MHDTLAKAKDKNEAMRLQRSESPGDVAACMRRELKDPYVFMPKLPQGGNKKKARVAAEDAPDQAIASSSGASIGGVREGGDVGLLVSPWATWPRVSGGCVGESKDPDDFDFDFDESDFDEDEMIVLLSNELPDAPEGRGVGLDEGGGVGLGTALGMGIGEGGGVVLARGFEDRHAQPHAGGACEAEDVGASGRGPMKVSKVMPKVGPLHALGRHGGGGEGADGVRRGLERGLPHLRPLARPGERHQQPPPRPLRRDRGPLRPARPRRHPEQRRYRGGPGPEISSYWFQPTSSTSAPSWQRLLLRRLLRRGRPCPPALEDTFGRESPRGRLTCSTGTRPSARARRSFCSRLATRFTSRVAPSSPSLTPPPSPAS